MTIIGGVTSSSPKDDDLPAGGRDSVALGGGVFVPPSANDRPGATVVIARSVISENLVAPAIAVDAGFSCGTADCQFAIAGGGVESWGQTTLRDSIVSDNQAGGPVTSDADGAGIYAQEGSLDVENTAVIGNHAAGTAPSGRFAEGAGIMFDTFFSPRGTCAAPQPSCQLVIRDSTVRSNASTLTSTLPAFGGGTLPRSGRDAHPGPQLNHHHDSFSVRDALASHPRLVLVMGRVIRDRACLGEWRSSAKSGEQKREDLRASPGHRCRGHQTVWRARRPGRRP